MQERVYFFELAKELGIAGMELPPKALPKPGGAAAMVHPNVWRKDGGEKLMKWLEERYHPGDVFEYDGHADCWLMLAVMHQLRACDIQTYIGAGFDRTLPITAYRIGGAPQETQPCTFTVKESGDNVLVTVHLKPDGTPFDLPFSEIVAPELPAGKNIFVRLDGRHLLFTFPMALTYGTHCKTLVMDYADECFCAVSNTPEVQVGDLVKNPFD